MVYDLIIIGAGPAGTAAGIYAGRSKMKILLIAKDFGGQMFKKTTNVENYPGFEKISGLDLIERFKEQLKKQDISVEIGEVTGIKKTEKGFLIQTRAGRQFQSSAVIVCSGADPRPLEVPGEKEFIGRGLSYCVHCDGPIFTNKTVAVVGGGNSGFEAAMFLANYVKKIYILESGPSVKADLANQELVRKIGKVEIITGVSLKEVRGDKFVSSVIYQDRGEGEDKSLAVDGVFVEIGLQPATSFLKGLVDFNEKDEVKVDPGTFQTKTPGLFVAGDITVGKFKQIVIATGEGAKAALSAYEYLNRVDN
ncbi:MAG: FAD-dependent oxidoreductase [Candidatus Wildermuthbacteria bacterium]|nr:FAD-dependent oxidoreductase [Candidatus Wildermuthbacteria bacterium]